MPSGRNGASMQASYQKILTGGMEPRAGKSNRMTDFFGNMKELVPSCLRHSTLLGAPSISAMLGAPRMWQAISPSEPQPKSKKPRQAKGAYAGLYGRMFWMPIQESQSSVSGTGASFGGSVKPCGQTGRLVHAW